MTTTELQSHAVALAPQAGEHYWFLGTLATIKVGGKDSAGQTCVIEQTCRQGFAGPLHVHEREDEWFFILEGDMTFYVGDETVPAPAGSFVYGPRNLPHTFSVDSDGGARFLLVAEPAGFEKFIAALGEPATGPTLPPPAAGPPDLAHLAAVAADHGITILGPPPAARSRES